GDRLADLDRLPAGRALAGEARGNRAGEVLSHEGRLLVRWGGGLIVAYDPALTGEVRSSDNAALGGKPDRELGYLPGGPDGRKAGLAPGVAEAGQSGASSRLAGRGSAPGSGPREGSPARPTAAASTLVARASAGAGLGVDAPAPSP